jgi:hypothetical protein
MVGELNFDNSEVRQAQPASLSQLAERINSEHEATEANARASIQHARAAGELLLQVKAQVGHGNWLAWVQHHCQFSERMARRYMKIADRWTELANRTRASDFSVREGLRLLAESDEDGGDELLGLTAEGLLALRHGMITESAARHLLRLQIYNRVATTLPFARFFKPDANHDQARQSWADHIAKLILWRPRFARTEEEIAHEVDSSLFDLEWVKIEYASLPEDEANKLAEQNMLNPDRDEHGLCSPEYWWAMLWVEMRPDYSQLSVDDWEMIAVASRRYLGIPEEPETPQADLEVPAFPLLE